MKEEFFRESMNEEFKSHYHNLQKDLENLLFVRETFVTDTCIKDIKKWVGENRRVVDGRGVVSVVALLEMLNKRKKELSSY